MPKPITVNQSLKFSSMKDEMPTRGPAIARLQLPPKRLSKPIARSPRGRR